MTPLYMLEVAAKHGVRKYTKAEFLHLPVGKEFFLMYVTDKGKIEIIKNVRVDGGKKENEGVWYHSASDAKKLQYCLRHEDLNDDSTFKTGVDGEIGYIYITEGENA